MQIMPKGTIDPSCFIYNNTFYAISGIMALAAVVNYTVSPVNEKYFEKIDVSKGI